MPIPFFPPDLPVERYGPFNDGSRGSKATGIYGAPKELTKAQIRVPVDRSGTGNVGLEFSTITLRALPEVSDNKSAEYSDEPIIGRSFPVKLYTSSGNRQIGMKAPFFVARESDISNNWTYLRLLQSAVYPEDETQESPAYIPPPICQIRLGFLFTAQNDGWISAILRSCNVSYPTDVVWDYSTYLPYRFDLDLQWDVVFSNSALPGQSKIIRDVPR